MERLLANHFDWFTEPCEPLMDPPLLQDGRRITSSQWYSSKMQLMHYKIFIKNTMKCFLLMELQKKNWFWLSKFPAQLKRILH